MKTNYMLFSAFLLFCAIALAACAKETPESSDSGVAKPTRAYGDKTPKIMTYIETNDINPLNAGDYYLDNGSPFFDIVEFFAANIHKRTVGGVAEPTLYLNPELTRLLEPDPANPDSTGYHKYVKRLQDKGIKVLVTVLGDWQGIGVANMNAIQTTQFADILAHVVEKYGLDGLGFSDSYANYTSTNSTSYSEIITKLRARMPAGKLITVFDWGYTSSISPAARAMIDYAYPGSFSAYTYSSPGLNLPRSCWSPMALQMGSSYPKSQLNMINDNAYNAFEDGYGVIMMFNMRNTGNRNPLSVFTNLADGAYAQTVSIADGGGNRPQDWEFIPSGYTITIDQAR